MFRFSLFYMLASFAAVGAFEFGSFPISGRVGQHYKMHSVSRTFAYSFIKKREMESINKDDNMFVISELNEAREMCRSREGSDTFVTFMHENGSREPDYILFYRKTNDTPTVYTIESLLCNNDNNVQMSLGVVEKVVRSFCQDHRGHLQIHPLKTWSNGRYLKAMLLERSFDAARE